MRLKKAVYEKINDMLQNGKASFPSILAAYPDLSEDVLFGVYLRKAHHDARASLRKISALKLRIDQLYYSYGTIIYYLSLNL